MHSGMFKDPNWPHPERSINKVNEIARVRFTEYLKEELGDQADEYLDKVLPDYPPFGKRILLDNGWFRMLTKDNVELVTDPIARCHGNKVITQNGTEIELDVLILATGFGGQKMIDSYEVVGRNGRSLREEWGDDDPKAYLGTMIPGFPNFFVLYGPNLQPGHGGSMTFSLEMQLRYVMAVIRAMLSKDLGAVEIRQGEYEAYNGQVDAMHEQMLWTHPGVSTYYRNRAGRVVINSPWRNVDFYRMTQRAELEKYEVEPARRETLSA
jgi:4-hydroxyacetophenone monooxygenase